MPRLYKFKPNYTVKPWAHIKETLTIKGIKVEEFRKAVGLTHNQMRLFRNGLCLLDYSQTCNAGGLTRIPDSLLFNLQVGYINDSIRLNKLAFTKYNMRESKVAKHNRAFIIGEMK